MGLYRFTFKPQHPAIILHEVRRLKAFEVGRNPEGQDRFKDLRPPVCNVDQLFLPGRARGGLQDDGHHPCLDHVAHLFVELIHIVKVTKHRAQANACDFRNPRSTGRHITIANKVQHRGDNLAAAGPAPFASTVSERRV